MRSSRKPVNSRAVWAARLIAFLVTLVILALLGRAWLKGASGCARLINQAAYFDADERARDSDAQYTAEPRAFTDEDYDQVFPDLSE